MLEILHDVAPKAELGFATAFTSDASFADNIRALRFEARLRRDRRRRPLLQRAPVPGRPDRAVGQRGHRRRRAVLQLGRQRGQRARRDLGQLRGRLRRLRPRASASSPAPRTTSIPARASRSSSRSRRESSAGVPVTLFWADPLGGAANDYDLYLLDARLATSLAFSQDVQDGDDDPYEILGTPRAAAPTLRLAVVQFRGADRYFQLSALRGRFEDSADGLVGLRDARRHARALGGASTRSAPPPPRPRRPLPFAARAGRPAEPVRPVPGPVHERAAAGALHLRRPAADVLRGRRHADHAGRLQLDGRRACARSPTSRRPTACNTSVDGLRPVLRHVGGGAARRRDRRPGRCRATRAPATADVREAFAATALDLVPAGVDGRTGRRDRPGRPRARLHRRDAAAAGHAPGSADASTPMHGRRRRVPRAGRDRDARRCR